MKRLAIYSAVAFAVVAWWQQLLLGAAGIVALVCVILALVWAAEEWRKWRSARRFRAAWGRQGKDLLIVYSNSPNWQRYIEAGWLTKWDSRAVVLNWSERKQWESSPRPEVRLFRAHAGDAEFNPLAIVVPASGGPARVVRFWRAFRDAKHGKDKALRDAEARLEAYLVASANARG
jgi:hypothetical protein